MVAAFRVIVEGVSRDGTIREMGRYQGLWLNIDERYIRGLTPGRREAIRRKVLEWMPKLKMDARIVCEKGRCAVPGR